MVSLRVEVPCVNPTGTAEGESASWRAPGLASLTEL